MRFLDPATNKTRGTRRRLFFYRPGQSMIVCITNRNEKDKRFNPAKLVHWKLAIVAANTMIAEWDFSGTGAPLPPSGSVRRINKVGAAGQTGSSH
jgi:hypothetical protein